MPDLYRGGVPLGRLTVTDFDQPWYIGRFDPTPAFDAVRHLFEEENRLLQEDGADDRWEAVWEAIAAPGLRLVWEDGRNDDEVLIHIDGPRADWRC